VNAILLVEGRRGDLRLTVEAVRPHLERIRAVLAIPDVGEPASFPIDLDLEREVPGQVVNAEELERRDASRFSKLGAESDRLQCRLSGERAVSVIIDMEGKTRLNMDILGRRTQN
jgi:hypothetical protein